ncbi:hypothetical protein HYPSUDRAFT_219903 [Hypholoma sublateritium FD-334 SS-4]|uniref:Fungal-type protein kinase domain-containing protein n=1 Tax=Hypholoma sublateritium (strain FD-334 SS-4) TaxID=945553 RepID=A0A0D2LXM1_HYPSF|nr:hypothetical protein HYPSUDRAFT_219903 [Hypholoma sublateritium FD-334 SS-4]
MPPKPKPLPLHRQPLTFDQFWAELGYSAIEFTGDAKLKRTLDATNIHEMNPRTHFVHIANIVSKLVRSKYRLRNRIHPLITFQEIPEEKGIRSPQLVATSLGPVRKDDFSWSGIEAAVEIQSPGRNRQDSHNMAPSFTTCLLQGRPDRISVQGFYVGVDTLELIVTSGAGVKRSPPIDLKRSEDRILLLAFVKRLYIPHIFMIDPTIQRYQDPETKRWLFDITLKNTGPGKDFTCKGYQIIYAREVFQERAHIFVNHEAPAVLNGRKIPVIKDVYPFPDVDNGFSEVKIIEHAHGNGEVPGVVRMVYAELVRFDDGSQIYWGKCSKTRICLEDYGEPLTSRITPKELLTVIYDSLEISRVIYRNTNIVHRDLSIGNILIKTSEDAKDTPSHTYEAYEASDTPVAFCGASYLLGETTYQRETRALIIDLERAEILDKGLPRASITAWYKLIQGTRFAYGTTARAVYGKVFPDRLTRFQCVPSIKRTVRRTDSRPETPFHELRYDAESIFWVLAWWMINATPYNKPSTHIKRGLWEALMCNDCDTRPIEFDRSDLHPSYAPMIDLLDDLSRTVKNDYPWTKDEPHGHPEFLHEALQRIILNFIFENEEKNFMNLPTSGVPRVPGEDTSGSLGIVDVKRGREPDYRGSAKPQKRARNF